MKSRLYTPPQGTYDLPFTWCYDASGLTNGLAYPNQYVYLKGGYGDFIMRRILGLSRVLNPSTGQYLVRDNSSNPLQQFPIYGASADDIGIAPELRYQETGAIKFDLGIIDLPAIPTTGQVCFQGVRRMQGSRAKNPSYQAKAKTFTYILTAPVNPPVGSFVTVRQTVNNYDFELYNIILLYSSGAVTPGAPFIYGGENGVLYFQNLGSTPITLNILFGSGPLISVVGNTITITDGAEGGATVTNFLTAWNASPAAALVSLTNHNIAFPNTTAFYNPPNTINQVLAAASHAASGVAALTTPISSLWLYDSNKIQVSSAPMVDIYMDGGPNGVYKNGAIVTPLWYPQNSQIQIDVYSQLAASSATLTIYLVGRQWLPCS